MAKTVVAIFESFDKAEKAAYDIRDNGLRTDNISILVKDSGSESYNHQINSSEHLKMVDNGTYTLNIGKKERVTDGIITGGILGGIAGLIAGAGSMFFPGFGMVAAAGPITGLIFGLVAGGLIGGLLDMGIPKSKSLEYERLISYGNVFFSMRVDDDRMDQIIGILNHNGALLVEKY